MSGGATKATALKPTACEATASSQILACMATNNYAEAFLADRPTTARAAVTASQTVIWAWTARQLAASAAETPVPTLEQGWRDGNISVHDVHGERFLPEGDAEI